MPILAVHIYVCAYNDCRGDWLEHITRMDGSCIPKQVLYGEFMAGGRPHGRHKVRYRDISKLSMLDSSISHKVSGEHVKRASRPESDSAQGSRITRGGNEDQT